MPDAPHAVPAPSDRAELERARRVFALQGETRWALASTSARERCTRLRCLRAAILRHRASLAAAVHADFGKHPVEFEVTELHLVLGEIAHALRRLPGWMRPRHVPTPGLLAGARSRIRFEPRGRVLVMAPWNYPFQLLINPLVSAVAAGNTVLLRPSERVPATAAVMARLVAETFPEEEVALVRGGPAVAAALLDLPFDHFFFTGSTRVGRKVMEAASRHLATVTLELGGKSPVIVDRSAELRLAAERTVWGKLVNAGQTCVAPDYVLVHEADEDAFFAAAREALARFQPDATGAPSADLARIVDRAAFDRLSALLEASLAAGARVAAGGARDAASRRFAPTLLAGVASDAPSMREEIFGPLLPVLRYRSLDEAIAFVRGRPPPLALYLFARDRRATERVLAGTTAGGTVINHVLCHLVSPELPFGGVGESGQGSYHGVHGFRAFSHERAVLHAGRLSLASLSYPPYGARVRRMAGLLTRWRSRG